MTIDASPPEILSEAHKENPWPTYEVLRDQFPIYFHAETKSWVVTRYEDVSRVLRGPGFSTKPFKEFINPIHGRTMLEMDGKEHSATRGLLNPYFHGNGLVQTAEGVREEAEKLLLPLFDRERDAVQGGRRDRGEVDLVVEFSAIYPVAVISGLLGLQPDYGQFAKWYRSMVLYFGNMSGDEKIREAGLRTRKEFTEYVMPIIAERRKAADGNDLISRLCCAEDRGVTMTDDDIRAFCSHMLIAGGETTDHAIADLFRHLLAHPDQLQAVYDDRSLIAAANAEALRYSTLVQWTQRQAEEDVELAGVMVPAGSVVTCLLAAADRDPRKFDEPDRFNIFREDNPTTRAFAGSAAHLAFGGGRHYCVGAMLSKVEVDIATNMILDNMLDLKLADGFVPQEEGFYVRSVNSLPVTFIPA
jgi:pulcherriminic acid synthase